MTSSYGESFSDLEARIARLEQRTPTTKTPMIGVSVDTISDNPVAVVNEPLDYSVGGWGPYPILTAAVDADGVPSGTWGDGDEGLLAPQASRMGTMIFLSGVVRRLTGVIAANTNQPSTPIFRLPTGWRPARSVLLVCAIGIASEAPEATTSMGTALIAVKPDLGAEAGVVKLVSASRQINAGASTGGWVALQGAFPATFT